MSGYSGGRLIIFGGGMSAGYIDNRRRMFIGSVVFLLGALCDSYVTIFMMERQDELRYISIQLLLLASIKQMLSMMSSKFLGGLFSVFSFVLFLWFGNRGSLACFLTTYDNPLSCTYFVQTRIEKQDWIREADGHSDKV